VVGALVVTHGELANELVRAAKKIVDKAASPQVTASLKAVAIDWDDDVSQVQEAIETALKEVDQGEGVVILTDMFGGTMTNISLTFLEPGRVEIVTGINLPMLIKLLNLRERTDLAGVVEQIREKGQRSIQVASELLGERLAARRKD
jgi:PTS system mannose-specific IIA component